MGLSKSTWLPRTTFQSRSITKSIDTWEVVYEEVDPDLIPAETDYGEEGQPGIIDVHSGSAELSLDGTPYSEW